MSTDSFHRRGAVSSRRGPADRWGSLVPPGRIRGRTGRWSEPLAPAQCGTSSSSRSGSRAGLDRSHSGTPLRKRKERREEKGWWMDALRRCYCLWRGVSTGDVSRRSRRSCGSRREQDKQHDTWFRHDAGTYSLRGGIRPPKDWWTYCALTWPRDRMMDCICAGQFSNIIPRRTRTVCLRSCRVDEPVGLTRDSHWNGPEWDYHRLSAVTHGGSDPPQERSVVLLCRRL